MAAVPAGGLLEFFAVERNPTGTVDLLSSEDPALRFVRAKVDKRERAVLQMMAQCPLTANPRFGQQAGSSKRRRPGGAAKKKRRRKKKKGASASTSTGLLSSFSVAPGGGSSLMSSTLGEQSGGGLGPGGSLSLSLGGGLGASVGADDGSAAIASTQDLIHQWKADLAETLASVGERPREHAFGEARTIEKPLDTSAIRLTPADLARFRRRTFRGPTHN